MDIAEDLQELALAKELEVQVAQQAEFAPAIRTIAMAVVNDKSADSDPQDLRA